MEPHSGVLVSLFELVIKCTIKVAFFYLLKFWDLKESTQPLIYNHFYMFFLSREDDIKAAQSVISAIEK